MFYYNVVFNIALNKGFTYKSDKEINIGTRVLVDFHNRKKVGVVFEKTTQCNLKDIKDIICIIDEKPVISEELIKTINFASYYYLCPKGLVLKNSLPSKAFSKDPIVFNINKKTHINFEKFFKLNNEQKNIYESIDLENFSVNVIFGVTGSGKTDIFLHLIKDVIEKGKNAVVLVPEISLTNQYKRDFEEKFSDTVGVYQNKSLANGLCLEIKKKGYCWAHVPLLLWIYQIPGW